MPMPTPDFVISARWIIPVDPDDRVLDHHSVIVRNGRIAEILPTAELRDAPAERIDLPQHALIPGLINAHTHAAMSLFRGVADDLPLMEWLEQHIWPLEGRFVDPAFCNLGVELAIAEQIRGGITCFNDMYFFPEATARTAARLGMRAAVSMMMIDFPTNYGSGPEEYLRKGLDLHDEWRSDDLISTCFAPHAPYTVSDGPLRDIRRLSDELGVPVHMHVHETAFEVDTAVSQTGKRPLTRLDELGLLNPNLMAVHMTQLTEAEIERLAATGASVVHCPESNLKLASGMTPVAALLEAGVNVAIGTDGAASNNDLDMLGETRTAALLAKGVAGNPQAVPAPQALRMATLGGARALGRDADLGSITPGKLADLCAIDLGRPLDQPCYEPVSQIVYSTSRDRVSHVWVGGQCLLNAGTLTHIDVGGLRARVDDMAQRIRREDPA